MRSLYLALRSPCPTICTAFPLLPGHSYFLVGDDAQARRHLRTTLVPLLEEYLAQGYVANFADAVRGYMQWLPPSFARGELRGTGVSQGV